MMYLVNFVLDKLAPLIYIYLRPFIKWFLHTFTRLSELQRAVYGAQPGSSRTKQVERSLMLSKNLEIKKLIQELDELAEYGNAYELLRAPTRAALVVCNAKHIKPRIHPDFPELFGTCVLYIWSYRRLVHRVERIRAEQYDSTNRDHEDKLLKLWNLLNPEEKLWKRNSKQWQTIGFQGDDPKTDFRGMGMLGLENLIYFASEYTEAAMHLLSHSQHPNLGYTFATVGINITALAVRLLKSGVAKTHFYNLSHSTMEPCSLDQFHKLYCYLFIEFDRIWMGTQDRCIMDFGNVYQDFEISMLEKLNKENTIFKLNLSVECV